MTTRDRLMLIVLAVAGLAAAGWFLVLAPMRDESSQLTEQIDVQRQTRDAALADISAGQEAKRGYARDYATVARLGAAIPPDDNVASLIVQVEQAADASDSDFRQLKAGTASGASTPAPVTPTDPAAATQTAAATLPPGAAVGSAGFPTLPFSFRFNGNFFDLADYVGRVQRFLVVRGASLGVAGRFMTLDGIGLNAAERGFPLMQASVAATTYMLPADQGLTNGATASGPAGTTASGNTSAAPSSGQTASKSLPVPSATVGPVTR